MTDSFHTVVWLDHAEARVFSFSRATLVQQHAFRAPGGLGNVHHKAGTTGSGHVETSPRYLMQIAQILSPAGDILITGPGDAKFDFRRHLEENAPQVATHVVAVEPLDRVDGGDLHRFATRIFRKADLMRRPA